MAPKPKGKFYYAVRKGRIPGIYSTWDECQAQTNGFTDAAYKKFMTFSDAQEFISGSSSTTKKPISASKEASSSDSKSKKRNFGPEVNDVTGWDIVYSDGACKGNGKIGSVAGVGVWWGRNDPRNIAERCPGDQTNNRAELIAILRVLESTPRTKKPLLIRTDSQYSIQCFRDWISNWRRKHWKTSTGDPVKNAGIIRCISTHLDIRGKHGQKVVLEYVKGHSGDEGNDGADEMANQGAVLRSVAERPWAVIESRLLQELSTINVQEKTPAVEMTVLAPDDLEKEGFEAVEAPNKVRKVSSIDATASNSAAAPPDSLKVQDPEAQSESYLGSNLVSTNPSMSFHNSQPSPLEPIGASPIKRSLISQGELQRPVKSPSQKYDTASLTRSDKATVPSTAAPTPMKTRKISSLPYIAGAKSPLNVICAQPPLVPVRVEDVNPDDYADCLLDDDDLANELSD